MEHPILIKAKAPLLLLLLPLFLVHCVQEKEERERVHPKSRFERSMKGKGKDPRQILGDRFKLLVGKDTVTYLVDHNDRARSTFVEDATRDTFFYGKITEYGDLYYLNRPIGDSAWWISAMAVQKDHIRGWGTTFTQMHLWDQMIDQGQYQDLVIRADTGQIRLRTDPDRFHEHYVDMLSHLPKYRIIRNARTEKTSKSNLGRSKREGK